MKRVIVTAGAKMHNDLRRVLTDKGYKVVGILDPPPKYLRGIQKTVAITQELSKLSPPLIDDNNITVVYAAGEETWWVATYQVLKAIIDEEPLVLTPVLGGYHGKYDCMRGTERGIKLP